MSDSVNANYVKSTNGISWQPHNILRVETVMTTPDWLPKLVDSGWVNAPIRGEVSVTFYLYPGVSDFYKDNVLDLINIVWEGGFRPACDTPFCCCEYATPGFPGYEPYLSEISASCLTDMYAHPSGPIDIEVFEECWQQTYVEDIRTVAQHFDVSFDEVFLENGYERRRQCETNGCTILFKGERYRVRFAWEDRGGEVDLIPDGVKWPQSSA
ncbi:protein of unknown function [Magnetospirillum sp. XM-1]|uniref:hypothetical protein n=1 Tax=Magnetospirillum sp. XM-1 TaxID=1663591 RepID=UPI00073DB931|nr:hypothetical protein [Magnetospirillum sp. XM-1]CUW37148.1 protein of unknown function [Magnetospirillum sp. XM-1]